MSEENSWTEATHGHIGFCYSIQIMKNLLDLEKHSIDYRYLWVRQNPCTAHALDTKNVFAKGMNGKYQSITFVKSTPLSASNAVTH